MKTGNVVLVVLERVEWDRKRQVGEAGVDAILLVNRHLVLFEVVVGDALPQDTNKEVVRELVLLGEPSGRDSFEPGQEGLVGLVELGDGIEGAVAKPVVISIVAESGGTLGKVPQIGLVLLVEKGVLGGETVGDWFEILGESGNS
jgi:hypothetical protein